MTATPDHDDHAFPTGAHLQRAHLLGTLTTAERAQLREACAADAELARDVAADAALHDLFARERTLRVAALRPGEASEEADETMARLAAAGARAEGDLRARLLHPVVAAPRRAPLRLLRAGALAVAALAAAWWLATSLGWFAGPPALQSTKPGDERLGHEVAGIVIAPHLSAGERSLSWSPVWQASGYEAVVVDAAGRVVLERAAAHARSTQWELTVAEFDGLRQRGEPLRLRVRALDSTGICVSTSGDLPLTIK